MLGQMHGPTVVCHSCRFRSFQYLFPLNVFSSPRFPPLTIASPFQSLSLSSHLCPRCFLLIVRFSRLPPSRSPLDRPFFSSFSRNYSFHCCMHGYIQSMVAWGYFFLRRLQRGKVSHFKNTRFIIHLRRRKKLIRFQFLKRSKIEIQEMRVFNFSHCVCELK